MGDGVTQYKTEARCPFFKAALRTRVTCEGPIDGALIMLVMHTRRQMDKQLRIFCCEHYEKCEIYRMVMAAKYEE